ncbi:MAG: hypothetical protein WDO16_14855 [Bacteroidota bacterium]
MRNQQRLRQRVWKYSSLVLLFQLAAVLVIAQVQITGKVTGRMEKEFLLFLCRYAQLLLALLQMRTALIQSAGRSNPVVIRLSFQGSVLKAKSKTSRLGNAATYTSDISLEADALKLDEVVLIGSSLTQSRKQLGNTVNSVSSKQLANTGSGNLTASLQGKFRVRRSHKHPAILPEVFQFVCGVPARSKDLLNHYMLLMV